MLVDIDALDVFAIDVSSKVVRLVNYETTLPGLLCSIGEGCAK